jgi:hypothetical protein
VRTRRIELVKPVQERRCGPHHDCCSIDGDPSCQCLTSFPSGGLPINSSSAFRPTVGAAGALPHYQHGIHL